MIAKKMQGNDFCINDEYDHVDDSIEYVLENVLCEDDKTTEYINLRELFNSILADSCACNNNYGDCKTCHNGGNYERVDSNIILKNIEQTKPIYECFGLCSCDVTKCSNRAVQFGPRKHLKIVHSDKYKSYGLITKTNILKGEFICEYAGELLTKNEAYKRIAANDAAGKMNYILCLRENSSINGECFYSMIVDPSRRGNIGRYLNHSCEPNCYLYSVRLDCPIPKIAIFAAKSINPGEELCIDYGSGSVLPEVNEKPLSNGIVCLCGTKSCKGYLPSQSF